MPVAVLAGYSVRSSCAEAEYLFGVEEVLGEILSQAQDDGGIAHVLFALAWVLVFH